jgi:hypothetical protein
MARCSDTRDISSLNTTPNHPIKKEPIWKMCKNFNQNTIKIKNAVHGNVKASVLILGKQNKSLDRLILASISHQKNAFRLKTWCKWFHFKS